MQLTRKNLVLPHLALIADKVSQYYSTGGVLLLMQPPNPDG